MSSLAQVQDHQSSMPSTLAKSNAQDGCMLLGAEVFHRRIEELRKHILERPEQCIAVVTHSGVLEALTGGVLFRNGEIRTLTAGELIARTGTQA